MSAKEIEVECPCCRTRLTIDLLTQSVLRRAAPAKVDETGKPQLDAERWTTAAERVKERPVQAKDGFDRALDYEKGKETHLDDLFEKAKRKLDRGRSDPST